MRHLKALALTAALVGAYAFANETYIGTLTPRGSSTNNRGAANDAGFRVPCNSKLTVQCVNTDAGSAFTYVCVGNANVRTCSSTIGVLLSGNQALPTSTPVTGDTFPDGGTTCVVSAYSAQSDNCGVFTRLGNE